MHTGVFSSEHPRLDSGGGAVDGDLDEDLRKNGLRDTSKIAEGRLERDGTVSVIQS